jgi:hypothetical protein
MPAPPPHHHHTHTHDKWKRGSMGWAQGAAPTVSQSCNADMIYARCFIQQDRQHNKWLQHALHPPPCGCSSCRCRCAALLYQEAQWEMELLQQSLSPVAVPM